MTHVEAAKFWVRVWPFMVITSFLFIWVQRRINKGEENEEI